MNKILSFIMIIVFIFAACEKKRERLTNNTFSISIDPSTAVNIYSGEPKSLKAICRSAQSESVNVNPVWSVTGNLGTFTPAIGRETTFKAGNTAGIGKIYATFDTASAQVDLLVGTYVVYSDVFASDLSALGPGKFSDASSSIALSATNESSEGLQALKAVFNIVSGGYAGWYVSASSTKNMSAYSSGYLRFDIMTSYDIQIGICSNNTPSGTNAAKKYISSYIIPNGAVFRTVSIPISDFAAAEASLDLTQMKDMFIATAYGPQIGAQTNKTFIIDNIRWTTN